ncbi:ribose operon transcriptional repressor RbsR [Mucilaginibacter gynuensis]|uniref:Ribose operon transcriptional repressor RbsR n=1 Tax=Mucilaginibacter gynuensis TaxID=1302236 RepID=A0ABP8G9Z0_9SPHI
MKKTVSIKDIAKLTDSSITTVSFVLNGKGRISEATRKKILDVAEKNGYQANRMAVGLRTGVSKVIGLVVENIGGHFFGALAKVIEEEAEKHGYRIIYCSTNNDIQKGREVIKMLSQQLVDGYIITPLKGLEDEVLALTTNNKPVVLIDGYFPGLNIPHVLVDNTGSVVNGINCFIKEGYKKIGFVTVDIELVQLTERLQGYSDTLKQNNIKEVKKNILKLPFDIDKYNAVEVIKNYILKNKNLDAIFFATNYLGILGLQALKELKLSIPDDIAVISFDDNELFDLYPPGITSIKQPTYEIAKSAIDILLSQLMDNKTDISDLKLQIPSTIIERGSTRAK